MENKIGDNGQPCLVPFLSVSLSKPLALIRAVGCMYKGKITGAAHK